MLKFFKAAGAVLLAATSVYAEPTTEPTLLNDTATTQPATTQASAPAGDDVTAQQVNVADDGNVEIHVNNANLVDVLRMLSVQCQRNIIASKDVHGTVTANLYDVSVRDALDAILVSNGYAYREKGNFIYVYTADELTKLEQTERSMKTEVFRLFYTPAQNAANIIKPVLSDKAQVSFTTAALSGLETGVKDIGGNSHATEDVLVISDYPDRLEAVRKVLKEIDQRPEQILIEATILRASLSDDNALGVDFNVLAGVNFSSIATSTGQFTGADFAKSPTPTAAGSGSLGTGNSFSSLVPPGGVKFGLVTNNIAVFLSALESTTNTTVLANPKVLALNKQKGEVIVGRKDGYLTTTVTESSSVQSVDFIETGTRLIFRPYIADDGYIRMEIHPEDSTGGLTNANLPFKITTEVTSNIMVKDGHTIVIGGLFRDSSNTARSQIPGLGDIPGLGVLFRNQRDQVTREEIIILMTPHVIKDTEGYSKESLAVVKDLDRIRLGVRQGMMPWGRDRMAESCYQTAVDEWNKPHPDRCKVLWHLNCALNLNPSFLEAIKLKEEITGRELRDSDNSDIHLFVKRRVLAERDIAPTTRPPVVDVTPQTHATTRPAMDLSPQHKSENSLTKAAPATQPSQTVASTPAQPSQTLTAVPVAQPSRAVASVPATQPSQALTSAPAAQASQVPASVPATRPSQVLTAVPANQPPPQVLTSVPSTQPSQALTSVPTE